MSEHVIDALEVLQTYYRHELSDTELRIYLAALAPWEPERLKQAVQRVLATSRWFPRLSELAEAVGGSETDAAVDAWSRLTRAIVSVGRYQSVDFGEAENAAIADMGGWIKLCQMAEREMPFAEKRFKTAYDSYRRGGVPPDRLRPCLGLEDADRLRLGLEPGTPVDLTAEGSRPRRQAARLRAPKRSAPALVAQLASTMER